MDNKAMNWLSALFQIDKLPFKVVFLIAAVSGFIAFASTSVLDGLHLTQFKGTHGGVIGIVFLSCFGLTVTNVVLFVSASLWTKYRRFRWRAELRQYLASLDDYEKAALREFFMLGVQHTLKLPIDDPTVIGLIQKGIVKKLPGLGEGSLSGLLFPCQLSKEARKRMEPRTIDWPVSKPTHDEEIWLLESRPQWAKDLARAQWLRES